MTRGLYFKHWGVESVFSSLHFLVSEIIPLPMSRVLAGMTCHRITNYNYCKIHALSFSLGNQLWCTCQSFTQCQTTAIFRDSQDSQDLWLRVFKAVCSDEEKDKQPAGKCGKECVRSSSPVHC